MALLENYYIDFLPTKAKEEESKYTNLILALGKKYDAI